MIAPLTTWGWGDDGNTGGEGKRTPRTLETLIEKFGAAN
jgi:hypothetical protein